MTAEACGSGDQAVPMAAALELAHCASLVHDDLPCFDDAPLRRGRPTVHRLFGEAAALLAGDALIVLAFEALVGAPRSGDLCAILARALGSSRGIIGGQAWELEREVNLDRYHRAKTAALFEAATAGGAVAAGHPPDRWRLVGRRLGEAYQLADDLGDLRDDPAHLNAARSLGVERTRGLLRTTVESALDLVPACAGRDRFRAFIAAETAAFKARFAADQG
jgi:geranylgeranyl diphosphate synthase type II